MKTADPTSQDPSEQESLESATTVWHAVKGIFARAMELQGEQRESYLEMACAEHDDLRSCMQSLLDLAEESGDWLRDGIDQAKERMAQGQRTEEQLANARRWEGQRLGSYEVVEELGQGGMGVVYLARRADGELEQQVAIKVIGRGPLTRNLHRRFQTERQILAQLDHPNIARFLDCGTTEEDIPYLVMERVEGEPITAHCRSKLLGLHDRLRLFLQVLSAVAFAHRNLVIHRDIKPSNILVTEEGSVKLLDFGIAKLLDSAPGEGATRSQHRPMTPAYASPEQRRGGPVSTASDVYSLGLVLYELLCGQRPLPSPTPPALQLEEQEIKAPSRVVSGDNRQLRGDLDHITLKAVDAEPIRRYGSAADLAADIQRYLHQEPVLAVPPGLPYRLGKFLRRNRTMALGLLVLLCTLAWGWWAQRREARSALLAEEEASAAVTFLVELFRDTSPHGLSKKDPTASELLERATRRLQDQENPRLRARLLLAVGDSYWNLGDYPRAAQILEEALELRQATFGPDHPLVGEIWYHLSKAQQLAGQAAQAEHSLLRSLEISRLSGDALAEPQVLDELSVLYRHSGRNEEALQLLHQVLEIRRHHQDSSPVELAITLNHLGSTLNEMDRGAEGLTHLEEALSIRRRSLPADHPHIASSLNSLAATTCTLGRFEECKAYLLESLAMRQRTLPAGHSSIGQSYFNLAMLHLDLDLAAEARTYVEQAVEIWGSGPGSNPLSLVRALSLQGNIEARLESWQVAESSFRNALDLLEQEASTAHPNSSQPLHGLANLLRDRGDCTRALPLYDQALETLRDHYGTEHSRFLAVAKDRAGCTELESTSPVPDR